MAPCRLKQAQDFMRANLGRALSLQEIAASAGMSLFHFARGFRQATGRPPHRYLLELRLSEARTLLHDAGLPIGEIARTVGFTHSHFTACVRPADGHDTSTFRDVAPAVSYHLGLRNWYGSTCSARASTSTAQAIGASSSSHSTIPT
jgi:transcriptional regulator GlxA family with amidase domain